MRWYADTSFGRRDITPLFRGMVAGWWVAGAALSTVAVPVLVALTIGKRVGLI